MGTPDFAVPSLSALINDNGFEVITVVTQPDKKIGRKQILTPTPVKNRAGEDNIPVLQPTNISEINKQLQQYRPDIIVVVAYAQKIPKEILDIPKYGVFNVHGSLLPKYRGASCLQAPILNGDKKTGITIMKMDSGLDSGDILAQKEIELTPQDTASTVHDRLAELGAGILPRSLKSYIQGKAKTEPQNNSQASYVRTLKKEEGKIDWRKPAKEIERMVRALNPWPGTYSYANYPGGKKTIIKILEVEPKILKINEYPNGTLFVDREEKLGVQCGENSLKITKIQPEGKKPMSGEDLARGYKDLLGRPLE
jgi:methionyl-tRNA formyltransferase